MNRLPPSTRRGFLKLGGSAALAGCWPRGLSAADGATEVVSILHTTDLHGNILPTSTYSGEQDLGGLARCATQIKRWRKESPHHLLVDLGDLYQGTAAGHQTEGRIMVDALNHLRYDAWVMGNHEFDWGMNPVESAVAASVMPVLAANTTFHGADSFAAEPGDAKRVQPCLFRDINGYRVAFIGLITPGMPNWFLPEALPGFAVHDPVEILERLMPQILAWQPHAVVLGAHMGIRPWSRQDDAANRLDALSRRFPEINLILGGHTHQEFAATDVNGIPYSQALYFGIRAGRADLVFDKESRRLLRVETSVSVMDASVEMDPSVLDLARADLEETEVILRRPVGRLRDTLDLKNAPGQPSDLERLICTAIIEGLRAGGEEVDAAIHGLLYAEAAVPAGEKTIRDMWSIIPFENFTVIAELRPAELIAILQEVYSQRNLRSLVGLRPLVEGPRSSLRVTAIQDATGRDIPPDRRLKVAFNSYDAASGGGRLETTREILARPGSRRRALPWQTRSLLIDFFVGKDSIGASDLMG